MAQIGAREARAGGAGTALVERSRVAREPGVPEVETALPGDGGAGPAQAGRQDAVEHVHPALYHLEDAGGNADSHEIARAVGGQGGRAPGDRLEHRIAVLPDAQT